MGEFIRWNKQLVHKCKIVAVVPLHLVPHIDLPTLCQIELKKFLRLKIFGYLIL